MSRHVKFDLFRSIFARNQTMARHGVDFETVKQTALKLLSKGISPSVQRIRESLGTGSNSTIAEHLKVWREQHAAKKVHHLPANLPPELIASFETLWQTAMEHAEKHLTDVKEALENQEEKLQQDKLITDKTIADFKTQTDLLTQKLDEKIYENQTLQTNLAVSTERFQNQADEISTLKQQHELRLKHLSDEKHQVIDEVNKLQTVIVQYKKELLEQAEKQQTVLTGERALQEDSEKRWINLIDQARTETGEQRKRFENTIGKQNIQIEKLQLMLSDLQQKHIAQHSILEEKNIRIAELTDHYNQAQLKHHESIKTIAVLNDRINQSAKRQSKRAACIL